MSFVIRQRRLDALAALSKRFAEESDGGLLGDCLDTLLETTAARAGAAFTLDGTLDPAAERRLSSRLGPAGDALRRALHTVAERATSTRRSVRIEDLRADREGVDDAGELIALGLCAVLAVPIAHRRNVLGALVLLFDDGAGIDAETRSFVETVTHMVALPLERAQDRDRRAKLDDPSETSRMVSLGLLTATVAHELRGPAGALLLQQEEMRRLLGQLELFAGGADTALGGAVAELQEVCEDIGTAIERVRDTVEQLGGMSRRQSEPEQLDLAAVVKESLSLVRPHLERRGVRLTTRFEPDCLTLGRRESLGQVLSNLVLNAADAAANAAHPEVWVSVVESGAEIALIVEDNGPGVPPGAVEHIFKPFYTTKQHGQGTGLGLKICSDVVSSHGGHIEVHDRPGGGASFRVLLPRVEDGSGMMPIARAAAARPRVRAVALRSILVVDDDPVFARGMRRALKPHQVRTAAAASEAEVLLLDPAYLPDLILCDIFLPGVNGDSLHTRISQRRPELASRFVFVTGGALGKAEADYLRACGCPTLFKPVDLDSLHALLVDRTNDSVPPNSVRTLGPGSMPSPSTPRISGPPFTRR